MMRGWMERLEGRGGKTSLPVCLYNRLFVAGDLQSPLWVITYSCNADSERGRQVAIDSLSANLYDC
jgi:hypothetical protein